MLLNTLLAAAANFRAHDIISVAGKDGSLKIQIKRQDENTCKDVFRPYPVGDAVDRRLS